MKTNKTGFTLVELLIISVVIAVLAGFAVPALREMREKARLDQEQALTKQLTPEQTEAKRLADLEQQKVAAEQAMEAKVNQVQNCGHGAYYFPFADMGEFLSVRNAFMDKHSGMKFVGTEPNIVEQGWGDGRYGITVGHVVFFQEE